MNTTPAVISDGVLWASTPLFAAAHLWSWHPLWAGGIWTVYGISALFPQGEAVLSQMAYSPLHYNFNPLHSRRCGLNYGSVTFEVPTNSNSDQVTDILIAPFASTSDLEYTAHAGEQDKSTSVVMDNVRVDDKPGPLSTSQWNAPDDIEGHSDSSALSTPDSSASLIHEIMPQTPSSSPASSQDYGSERSSLTSSPLPSSRIMQPFTSIDLEMRDRPTPLAVDDHRSPPSSEWPRLSKNRPSFCFGDYEIWGRPVRQWWPSLVMFYFNLFVLWCVYSILRWAHRKLVREPLPSKAAPPKVPAANTITMVASEAAAPTSNQWTLDPVAQTTSADWHTTIRKYLQQWGQGLVHYWQAFKRAFTARKIQCHIWVANLIWGDSVEALAQLIRVTAILVCGVLFAQALLEEALTTLRRAVPNDTCQTGFTTKLLTSRSTAAHAPDKIAGTFFNCLWQIKQCTTSALQTRLSPDGSYPTFSASSSHTDVICERILQTIMSFKAIRLAISRTFLGKLLLR